MEYKVALAVITYKSHRIFGLLEMAIKLKELDHSERLTLVTLAQEEINKIIQINKEVT
jgi:glucose-6-phosphate-specific signal transduction histidine kinase